MKTIAKSSAARRGQTERGGGSVTSLRRELASMLGRVTELNARHGHLLSGPVGHGMAARYENYGTMLPIFKDSFAALMRGEQPKDEAEAKEVLKQRTELCGLLDKMRDGNESAMTELNDLHTTQIDLYVRATSNFTQFFQTINLEPAQQAVFINTYRNEVRSRYIGQDGGIRSTAAVRAQSQTFIDLKVLTTDDIGYQIRDINLGTDIAAMSRATVDLSYDLTNKVDLDAYNLYLSLLGVFRTTGAKLSQTYLPNSRVDTTQLPTTNVWDLSQATYNVFETPGTSGPYTLFRLAVIRATMNYCARWANLFGAPVRPTGVILIPASESTQLSQEITPTGSTRNAVADEILSDFTTFDYMGVRWALVPDITIPVGKCFPVLNRPVGHLYLKPSMDEEFVTTDKRKNWETRALQKALNYAAPEHWRMFAFQVIYHS